MFTPVQQGALNNHPAGESSGPGETSAQIHQDHEGNKKKDRTLPDSLNALHIDVSLDSVALFFLKKKKKIQIYICYLVFST